MQSWHSGKLKGLLLIIREGRDLQVVIIVHVLPKDVTIQGLAMLIDRRLAPASWLEAELCAWWDGSTEPRHLHSIMSQTSDCP